MTMLAEGSLKASRRFLQAEGRPLEKARYDYAFGDASSDAVLEALAGYQNEDGGFGRALEPDLRAPESSVLCTSVAFQILDSLDTAPDHSMVSRGIDFLLVHLDQEQHGWRIIPETADSSPRAPWWYQAERKVSFEEFSLNPTAEILGYLYDSQQQVATETLSFVSDRVLSQLKSIDEIEMHDLLCCLRLLKAPSLPDDYRHQVAGRVRELIDGIVACDPDSWKGYGLRPLQVAEAPQSPFIKGLEQAVDANLDYKISTQNTDGSWTPNWSWDDAYPNEWAKAKSEWAGIITVEKLLTLKRFGRIEGVF